MARGQFSERRDENPRSARAYITRDTFRIDETMADQLIKRVRVAEDTANTDYFELPHSFICLYPILNTAKTTLELGFS
jgi:hypothetical protein